MYQPQQNMCVLQTGNTATPTAEDGYAISWIVVEDPAVTGDPYPVGRIDAIDISTGRQAWRHEQRAAVIGTAVSTAGGLLFVGDINRRFMAFDDSTGELLWQVIVSAPVSGSAISYAVGGRQYIAVAVGGGTASPERRALSIHTELKPPRDSLALFVFALPER
jgi:alcohol dehydrogenase (cytochrome c)